MSFEEDETCHHSKWLHFMELELLIQQVQKALQIQSSKLVLFSHDSPFCLPKFDL